MKNLKDILTFIIVAISSTVANASLDILHTDPQPSGLSENCQQFINSLPSNFSYGWIDSKESNQKALGTVSVFYYYDSSLPGDPILYLNGGPSENSWSSYLTMDHFMGTKQIQKTKFLFIDQRGTGCSTPYPLKDRTLVDYVQWGSVGIIRDSEVIRERLGLKKWSIFGQSYGGSVVLRYIQEAPESLISAVTMGSAVLRDRNANVFISQSNEHNVISAYFAKYPSDESLVDQIIDKNVCLGQSSNICGRWLINQLAIQSIGFRDQWSFFHEDLAHYASMPPSGKKAIKPEDAATSEDTTDPMDEPSIMMMMPDYEPFSRCKLIRESNAKFFNDQNLLSMTECDFANPLDLGEASNLSKFEKFRRALKESKVSVTSTRMIGEKLKKYPAIDSRSYSGTFDYYTAPKAVEQMQKEIGPRLKYKNIEDRGHDAFIWAPEILKFSTAK